MAADLVLAGDGDEISEDDEVGLTDRQVQALEWLEDNGHEPAPQDKVSGKFLYHKDPQVRAYQMIFQGRFGGSQPGAGRPRAAQSLAEYVRTKLQPKLRSALDRALDEKAGPKLNLEAVKLATDIEFKEGKLKLDEQNQDLDQQSKEELLGTLFALLADPSTAGAIEGSYEEDDIPEATVVGDNEQDTGQAPRQARVSRIAPRAAKSDSARSSSSRHHTRSARSNGRGSDPGDREKGTNPYTQAPKRRAANRRRAS